MPQDNSNGGWEHIYFSVDENGKLKVIELDVINVTNSKLEEISKEEKDRILRKPSDG